MTADSVPAPMVQVSAALLEAVDRMIAVRQDEDPAPFYEAFHEVVAARAAVDAATPAASVPAADILALADNLDEWASSWLITEVVEKSRRELAADILTKASAGVRDLVAAAEQADKGEGGQRGGKSQDTATPHDPSLTAPAAPVGEPLREQIAAEIEKQGRAVVEWLAGHSQDATDRARVIGTEDAYKDAVRIAREEKFDLADVAVRVPVNDEAEGAWQAWATEPDNEGPLVGWERRAFLAGFRAARQGGSSDE